MKVTHSIRRALSGWLPGALCLVAASTAVAQPAVIPAGTLLPGQDHVLALASGGTATVGELTGARGTVVVFWSNTCQWSEGYYRRVRMHFETASEQNMLLYLVNANDPDAFPEEARQASAALGYPMPYAMDAEARFARMLGAFRTPQVFVFDAGRNLVYSGAIDDAPANADDVQEPYLETVIAELAAGRTPSVPSTRAFGCRIRFPGG